MLFFTKVIFFFDFSFVPHIEGNYLIRLMIEVTVVCYALPIFYVLNYDYNYEP